MAERPTNPVKVIRAKCLECCCGQVNEVALCVCTDCPLYEWRFGKNPYRVKRELTEEQKQQRLANFGRKKAKALSD